MFGTSRRRFGAERASPVLRTNVAAAAAAAAGSAASKQHMLEPPLADGGGASFAGAAKGLVDEGSGRRDAEVGEAAVPGGGAAKPRVPEAVVRGLAYGMVNGILLPPVMVSFAAMIFRDPAFTAHLPRLVKLVMFSGAVHMACFGALSSLKFAVGSVQDAGLIFLSAIASSVVAFSKEEGLDEAGMLSTACFILCTCTGLLGVALVVLGRLRLASVVQYLPMPVIGGYLAFIGYFCGQAGLAFASGREISSIRDLVVLADPEAFLLVLPAIVAGAVMYLCLRRYPSPATLPILMAAFLGTFFAFFWVTGTTIEEARAAGWVSAASPMLPLNRAWDYFSFADVRWGAFARVTPNLFAMIVVVAFSSCLDVAAIEMEMGTPLDFNGELQTVGWSNVVSGLFGGFTGSYIFSQTIFNLRAGVDTRMASATSTCMILSVAASPVSVISFLPRPYLLLLYAHNPRRQALHGRTSQTAELGHPNEIPLIETRRCFFGALLVLISVDLMVEWLWQARVRMMNAEYMVCLATFAAIQAWGVEKGMLAGLVLAALSFTITYAQVPTVMTARVKTSTVMRTFEERVILKAHQEQTVVLELQGYIFFGSAVKILAEVKDRIVWGTDQPEVLDASTGAGGVFGNVYDDSNYAIKNASHPQYYQHHIETAEPFDGGGGFAGGESSAATNNPRMDVAMSPVFNRSGAVYRSSSSFSSAAPPPSSSVRPESSPLPRRNPLSGRSRTWREHSQQHPEDPVAAARGRSTAYPLPRTMSAGGANRSGSDGGAATSSVASITGAGGGRPFHESSIGAAAAFDDDDDDDEQAPLVSVSGTPAERGGGTTDDAAVVRAATGDPSAPGQRNYGAMEEGEAGHGGGGGGGRGVEVSVGGEARGASAAAAGAVAAGEGAVQAYMSLWANGGSSTDVRGGGGDQGLGGSSPGLSGSVGGGSPGFSGRVARSASVVSLLPASEQRTRRVILDFSNVVGVDATAARSCFLMLKIVLRTSGADVVFSGATRKVQALLRSHGVITDNDPVFNSLDTALEWSEEVMLQERRDDMILRRAGGAAAAAVTTAGSSLSLLSLRQQNFGGAQPSPLVLENQECSSPLPPTPPRGADDGAAAKAGKFADDKKDESEEEGEEDRRPTASSEEAEAAAFLGDHEDYYFRAGTLRRRSSVHGWISDRAGDNPLVVGDVGSLQSILEDYLEVDRFQAPESVRGVLGEAHSFFRQEHVSAGAVLADNKSAHAPEKLYFIGAGSVELQIPGENGPRRFQKVCAGGTFGEMGFFLKTPPAFRAVARESCHLHTLDRVGMAAMQRQNPGLCILVQKALMKHICLAASLSIESAHLGPVDDGRSGRLGRIEEEH